MINSCVKRIYATDAEQAKKNAIEILQKENKTVVKVGEAIPFQDSDKGYSVPVIYTEPDKFYKINLEELIDTRKTALKMEEDIDTLTGQLKFCKGVLATIREYCNHEIVVKTSSSNFHEFGYCLICNQLLSGEKNDFSGRNDFNRNYEYIIDFARNEYEDEPRVELAFSIFEEERMKNPKATVSEIVAIVNDRIKNNQEQMLGSQKIKRKPQIYV